MKLLTDNETINDRLKVNLQISRQETYSRSYSSGFILAKNAMLSSSRLTINGCFGGYVDGDFFVNGEALIIEVPGFSFNKQIVSTVDPTSVGDLSYIDGCSNTVVIPPPRNGDACVNYLYFPPRINQTAHTHPSIRIGYVLAGSGMARTNDGDIPLKAGDIFVLPRHTKHGFVTSNGTMSLMVFHPDSEGGPTDERNPMKLRTLL